MKIHRFFVVDDLKGKTSAIISDEEIIHQWKNVFRLRAGDRIVLLDNSGEEYLSEITLLSKEETEVKIISSSLAKNIPQRDVWLFCALIKKDNFEWILEKCTEIGMSHFVPVLSERSEKKNLNMERARKIIKEASEQSERGILPELKEIMDLDEAIKLAQENGVKLVALHPTSSPLAPLLGKERGNPPTADGERTGYFIGPEGGWSEKEVELFKSKNIPLSSLGTQILRAETAAVAVSALLLL